MIAIAFLFVRMLCDAFKPRQRLEAEILVLRHQLSVLQQHAPRRALHLDDVGRSRIPMDWRRATALCSFGSIVAVLAFLTQ
jgi:hypothetical protein